jgi:rhodanese-related sulfurtransferase
VKRVLQEALLVAVIGAILAFLANSLSPRGLKLTRDYDNRKPLAVTNALVTLNSTNAPSPAETLAADLQAQGLQLARSNQVLKFFHDPGYQQGLIAFLDARHPEDYEQGHIPKAYLFDYAHPEAYVAGVFPACQIALQVVVYCNGGQCEDSERAALFLRDLGIPREKLFVYAGGITEWRSNALPIELGERNSGKLLQAKP